MDYRRKFQNLFDNLSNVPEIEIITQNIDNTENQELADFSYRKLTKRVGFNLEKKYTDYFLISLHTHLRYVYYQNNEVVLGGEFHLYPLSDTLRSNKDTELWIDDMEDEKIGFLKTLRIFDDHPDSGDFKMAAFSKQKGIHPPKVPDIYFYDRGEVYKMNIDYGGYLDALLDLVGISNWQYLFCDINKQDKAFEEIFQELKTAIVHLENLFPDKDYDEYFKMLK